MQQLRLLDKNRNLLAILDRHAGWSFESKINEATTMTINIPKNDDKLELVELAELIRIIKDDRVITGRITKKEQKDQVVTLKAMTEEILLESNICPAQYGLVYQNIDLADFTRDVLKGWETLRVKYQSEWQNAIEMHQVDLTNMPNKVILAKDSNGQYYSEGYIILRFDSADIDNFSEWDRIRWVSDNSDPVSSTIQYRYGNDTSAMGSWSNEIAGALTDQLGVALSGITDRYVDVKINLYTEDTTSADKQGQPQGVTPIAFALELIARTTAEVQEGIIPISTGKKVKNITADNSNSLELLVNACNQVGWEFEVIDGKLDLAENLGQDRTNDFILKHEMNINIDSLGEDDSKLCNLLHAYGPGEGINRPYVKRKDDISIGRYGLYPKTVEFDVVDKQDLEQKAQGYIDAHKNPVSEFKVKAIFPTTYNQAISNLKGVYETISIFGLPLVKQVVSDYGEQIKAGEPYFRIGDKVKLVDPESRIVTTARIMEEKRAYTDKGIEIELYLNNPRKSLYDALIGDEEKSDDEELQLNPPQGLRVLPAQPGLLVYVNPYTNSRATGVEIHISTSSGFEASDKTLIRKGQGTQWHLQQLTTGNRYYIKARSYDFDKNYSEFTDEFSAVAGFIEKQQLNPDLQENIDYAKSEADVVKLNKEAWNLAKEEVFPEGLENASSITENAEEISSMILTLNSDNDDPAQFSSIKQTAQSILNIVSVLESDPESANQYSAIKQMLEQIQLRVVKDELISQINLSPESVKIQGNKIVITGDTVVEDGALSTQKLIVGNQIPMRKPNSAQLFHFDRSFLSTDGVQAQFSDSSYQLIEGKFGKALDLQTSTMTVPLNFTGNYTIVFYFWDGSDWIYVAKRSDGRVFSWKIIELWSVWGIPGYKQEILDTEIDISWINVDVNGDLQVSSGYKMDELIIVPDLVDEDSIYSWYKSDAPFVDSQSVLSGGGWYSNENGLYSYDDGFKIEYDEAVGKWNAYFGGILEGKIVKGENIQAKTIKAEQYQEIRNVLPFNYLDSLDDTHPLECDFYIPSETVKIVSIKLSAKGLPFRAYAKGAAGGGGWDGNTTLSGNHSHFFSDSSYVGDSGGSVSISGSTSSDGYHSHSIKRSAHTHDFIFGIYEDTIPANVTLQINNGSAYTETIELGSDEILADELDLTDYFTGTGWKGIKFSSSQLGRVNAQLIVKVDLTA